MLHPDKGRPRLGCTPETPACRDWDVVSEMAGLSAGVMLCNPLPTRRCNETFLECVSVEARCKSHSVSSLLHPSLKGCSAPQLPVFFLTVPHHSPGSQEIFFNPCNLAFSKAQLPRWREASRSLHRKSSSIPGLRWDTALWQHG